MNLFLHFLFMFWLFTYNQKLQANNEVILIELLLEFSTIIYK